MFALLWIIAELFHLISSVEIAALWRQGERVYPLEQLLIFLLALAYLVRGRGQSLFLLVCALQVIGVLWVLPVIPNHQVLAAILNAGILASALRNNGNLTEDAKAFCRAGAIILYLFAAFHKLNADYLNPAFSCATSFFYGIAKEYSITNLSIRFLSALPFVSLATEFAIPLLLICRGNFRVAGIILGALFHFVLALHSDRHFFDFSATMFALLFLFQPNQEKQSRALAKPWRIALAIGFCATMTIALGFPNQALSLLYLFLRMKVWALFTVLYFILIFQVLNRPGAEPAGIKLLPRAALLGAGVFLLLLNGISPYLGLKDRSSFDMYSNLKVEGGRTNHLLYPAALLGNFYTGDLVQPVALAGASVRPDLFDPSRRMVRFELASLLMRTPGLQAKIQEGTVQRVIHSAGELYPDGHPPPWILRKLLWFRPVEQEGQPNRCQW